MPDKVSLNKKKAIQSIKYVEGVVLRVVEAAEKITSRLFLYAWAVWHIYLYFIGKH